MLAWLKMMSRRRYYWADDACSCCGGRFRFDFPVIWDKLAEDWNLTDEQRGQLDRRDAATCQFCYSNGRARSIGTTLLEDIAETKDLRFVTIREMARTLTQDGPKIAEINWIPGLHQFLSRMPSVTCSEFGTENSQDLMQLTYGDETFDYVLTSDTLEHVPDFDLAMREVRRILKPKGKHIFTIPVLWDRETRTRASLVDGKIVHHLPPSYHGTDGVADAGCLVCNEFGGDVVQRIEQSGFKVSVHRSDDNPLLATLKAEGA